MLIASPSPFTLIPPAQLTPSRRGEDLPCPRTMAGNSMDPIDKFRSGTTGERRRSSIPGLEQSSSYGGILQRFTSALVETGLGGPAGLEVSDV